VALTDDATGFVDDLQLTADGHTLAMFDEVESLLLDPTGQGDVVSVHARDEFAAGLCEAGVQRIDEAHASARHHAKSVIFDAVEESSARVVKTIVDDEQLAQHLSAAEDRLDGGLQEWRSAVGRQHHADVSTAHATPRSISSRNLTRGRLPAHGSRRVNGDGYA
jgi:hypothetical protein